MSASLIVILFAFGAAIGSFLNVVILRYDGDRFLLSAKTLGGRSHCPHCGRTLRWFELVPIASWAAQGGRCCRCGARLTAQYPVVELLSGLIFVFAPLTLGGAPAVVAALWIVVLEALLVMSFIDIRLGIIPDEINIAIAAAGVFLAIFAGGGESGAIAKLIGAAAAGAFFGALIAVTRGKGMGMGDLKLAIPLGLVFGWPMIALALIISFVTGAIGGLAAVMFRKRTMKGTVPFGPFLAIGAGAAFLWGPQILAWYLPLLGVR